MTQTIFTMSTLGDPPAPAERQDAGVSQTGQVSYVPRPAVREVQKLRPGGRRAEETRPYNLRVAAVPNAAGSAYVEQGRTKILAAVYGPRQVVERTQQQVGAEGLLLLDLQFAPFSSTKTRTREENDKRALLYSSLLQGSLESVVLLERYPKTAFDVNLLVLEDDGAVLTASLTAAALALCDAKVEMKDIIAGATVHLVGSNAGPAGRVPGTILLDCDSLEESELPSESTVLHLGLCPSRGSVCLFHSAGPVQTKRLEQMVLLAKDTATAVGAEIRRCLESRVARRAAKRARLASGNASDDTLDVAGSLEADSGLFLDLPEESVFLDDGYG